MFIKRNEQVILNLKEVTLGTIILMSRLLTSPQNKTFNTKLPSLKEV